MRTRHALTATAAAVATLALAACTSASQSAEGGGSASFDAATVAKDDAIAALVPAAVAQDGKLTVGSDLTYAPAEFVGADGKTPVGFDIEIATAMARLMGLEADIQSSTFDAIIPGVGTRYEVGVSSFTVTPERLEAVDMVTYINAGSQFAVATGNPDAVDPDDLCGLTIGVQTGTTQQDELEQTKTTCPADKPLTLLPYEKQADVTTNLVGGKVQAMYADSPVTAYAVGQADGKLELLGDIRDAAPEAVVVPHGDAEMAKAVRAALQKLMDDGTLTQILAGWGNEDSALSTSEISPQAD
ncbi:ABC transporter substrate-binding protein [Xylanimonas ulmi]|uniref:Amino acid ABC transporter substrate-binding protein (PAAT family) n=1 Tax=Xylanimonas ulmi TaxID=228973 RepID=A0A4Q7M6N1_9MICO|nr:ABC transporter substrate-binding protein [Xylanibacterium ulmi]RZS62727.1 amino acid ABC transporter substrate-binding protein (PAAT family) [Xylanibacterium ulmi]